MRLGGISPDVSNDVPKVFAISNEAIKVVVLPKLALKPEFLMDHACGAPFPSEEHLFEQRVWMQHQEQMHVIRHDHIREQFIPLLIEVGQRFDDGSAEVWLPQDTGAMPIVQPSVHTR